MRKEVQPWWVRSSGTVAPDWSCVLSWGGGFLHKEVGFSQPPPKKTPLVLLEDVCTALLRLHNFSGTEVCR